MIGDRGDRVGDERLRSRADNHVVREKLEPPPRADVLRRDRAQLVDAGRRRVAVLTAFDRGDARLLDVLGRREIGLADAERNDVLSLPDQRIDFRQHDESVLGAERFGPPREFHRERLVGSVHRPTPLRC
jgi:hypothetical protein